MTDQPERRQRGDFEKEVIKFMARIDQHMEDQKGRCDSHSKSIAAVEEKIQVVESVKSDVRWLDRWMLGVWSAILVMGGWIFAHATGGK